MATWYMARYNMNRIEPVEVERESEQCVWARRGGFGFTRQSKSGRYESYWPTWRDAHTALMTRRESDVAVARRALEVAQSRLGYVKGMKPPANAAEA